MSITIRKAVLEDAHRLAQLAEETFRLTFSADCSAEDINIHCQNNFGKELQKTEILDSSMVTLLCEVDDVVIGYAQLGWKKVPECLSAAQCPAEIRRIYVVSEFHGQGVAQDLMSASIEEATSRCSDIAWLGVWEHNPKAISFYKKFDFAEVGEQEFYLGNDLQHDIVMARDIKTN